MKRVCVVGGGPAGMMAAYAAASAGANVQLFERNEKLGKKLYITGKGRCNITNDALTEDFFDNVVSNPSFLYSALYTFGNNELLELLKESGLKTKTERGGRVFPVSDKSSDVIKAFSRILEEAGVKVYFNSYVNDIKTEDGHITGIVTGGEFQPFDRVIIATGGLSYPSTGSTGDGYDFARKVGHRINKPTASLIAADTFDDVSSLAGLTLKNISLTLFEKGRKIYCEQGEMLFTHTGVSGPLVLTASAYMDDSKSYDIEIDLKPALDYKTLDARLVRDLSENSNKDFSKILTGLTPSSLVPFIVELSLIAPDRKANSITKEERANITRLLKAIRLKVKCKRPIEEAIITRGGVDVLEIDASTMQSKLCCGLYFAGEVIDVDALTGGYNLQIAFSTGYLAGIKQ